MSDPLAWGILGTGNIAGQFADALSAAARGRLAAVGSRERGGAERFVAERGLASRAATYDELLADRDVEAIYVALPNAHHRHWTERALEAGKHVLCEKPLAPRPGDAESMFDAAERNRRVLMEAFMYRSHPVTEAVLDELARGAIGELRMVRASFCFRLRHRDANIRFSPELAGGALMDVGCYCLDLARRVAGTEPARATVSARVHASGVDESAVGTLAFPGGELASFSCGMGLQADNTAYICGDEGYLEIPVPWKPPETEAIYRRHTMASPRAEGGSGGPQRKERAVDAGRPVFALEADDFAATVRDGAAPRTTRAQSVGNARLLASLRKQAGLSF